MIGEKTVKQRLSAAMRRMRPHDCLEQGYWSKPENRRRELREVKAHIRNKFEEQASYLVIHGNMSRADAEEKALESALFRVDSWIGNYEKIAKVG